MKHHTHDTKGFFCTLKLHVYIYVYFRSNKNEEIIFTYFVYMYVFKWVYEQLFRVSVMLGSEIMWKFMKIEEFLFVFRISKAIVSRWNLCYFYRLLYNFNKWIKSYIMKSSEKDLILCLLILCENFL